MSCSFCVHLLLQLLDLNVYIEFVGGEDLEIMDKGGALALLPDGFEIFENVLDVILF